MSSPARARCIAVILAAVLLLSAVVPAQAAPLDSRGDSSGVLSTLWSWLEAAWGAFVPAGAVEKEGSQLDPNGNNLNGGPVESAIDEGALIDPNGGRP